MTITRQAAIRLGVTKYTAGKPCKHGHGVIRYTGSGKCVACLCDRSAAEYAAKSAEEISAYCASRRDAARENSRKYRARKKAEMRV